MAKIVEEQILIVIGRLVKEGAEVESIFDKNPDLVTSVESIAQELIGDAAIVEARIIGNK